MSEGQRLGLRWGDLQHGHGAFLLGASGKQLCSCILHNSFLTLRFPSSKGSHNRPGPGLLLRPGLWPLLAPRGSRWPAGSGSVPGLWKGGKRLKGGSREKEPWQPRWHCFQFLWYWDFSRCPRAMSSSS